VPAGTPIAALWRQPLNQLRESKNYGRTNEQSFRCWGQYQSQTANVNGVTIHYLRAGTGKTPLVLIHGFGDTSHMWVPLFDEFGKDYTIIAPDIRGLGDSSRPATGYDKKTMAVDIHELVKSLAWQNLSRRS